VKRSEAGGGWYGRMSIDPNDYLRHWCRPIYPLLPQPALSWFLITFPTSIFPPWTLDRAYRRSEVDGDHRAALLLPGGHAGLILSQTSASDRFHVALTASCVLSNQLGAGEMLSVPARTQHHALRTCMDASSCCLCSVPFPSCPHPILSV
jgi:hypothetical protein